MNHATRRRLSYPTPMWFTLFLGVFFVVLVLALVFHLIRLSHDA